MFLRNNPLLAIYFLCSTPNRAVAPEAWPASFLNLAYSTEAMAVTVGIFRVWDMMTPPRPFRRKCENSGKH